MSSLTKSKICAGWFKNTPDTRRDETKSLKQRKGPSRWITGSVGIVGLVSFVATMGSCNGEIPGKIELVKDITDLTVTPAKIVITPTTVEQSENDIQSQASSAMNGGSAEVTLVGVDSDGIPHESEHAYVCLGDSCLGWEDKTDRGVRTDSETDDLSLVYSKWAQLLAQPEEDGRGCRNVSTEVLHCIFTADGTARFKVITSGAPYPFSKGIPISVGAGGDTNRTESKGNIWIGYGLPKDTRIEVKAAPKISMQNILLANGQTVCSELVCSCNDYVRKMPFSLRLVKSPDGTDNTEYTDVTIDTPIWATASVSFEDDSINSVEGQAWLARNCNCSANDTHTSAITLKFPSASSISEEACVCVNGVGGNVKLTAEVRDFSPQSDTSLLGKTVTIPVDPQLARLSVSITAEEGASADTETDTDTMVDASTLSDFTVSALDCTLNPIADVTIGLGFDNVMDIDLADNTNCIQQICQTDSNGQIHGSFKWTGNDWRLRYKSQELATECIATIANLGGVK
ncbi:MAG: hypothetical protein JXR76_22280 [Deltaproteobacteria bacterium]|nr:hypothetical protein [Deltaproteobacteria bacterium]